MHVTLVHVRLKPERVEEFVTATKANDEGSRKGPENVRFDVLQSAKDPTRFVLYEVFSSEGGAAAHKEAPHSLAWSEKDADWTAFPREGERFRSIFPEARDRW